MLWTRRNRTGRDLVRWWAIATVTPSTNVTGNAALDYIGVGGPTPPRAPA
jgi:hypothetical protein